MTVRTKVLFDDQDYYIAYDWDDGFNPPRITAVHAINRQSTPLSFGIYNSADDSIASGPYTLQVGQTVDRSLSRPQQMDVQLDSQGRISNLYVKTL